MSREHPRKPDNGYQRHVETCTRKKMKPFRVEEPLIGQPPSCSWESFRDPRLRKCPLDMASIRWSRRLGGGIDGYVWKVYFGQEGPFALKVFWESEVVASTAYWALQLECQNVALLEMITYAVQSDPESIYLFGNPKTKENAIFNLFAFSEQGRQVQLWKQKLKDPVRVQSMPRLRKCYGWLDISGEALCDLGHQGLAPPVLYEKDNHREILRTKEYTALVYEYIPSGKNDLNSVQETMDFFWRAGFHMFNSLRIVNWERNILLDMSEISGPYQMGFMCPVYERREADMMFEWSVQDYIWLSGPGPLRRRQRRPDLDNVRATENVGAANECKGDEKSASREEDGRLQSARGNPPTGESDPPDAEGVKGERTNEDDGGDERRHRSATEDLGNLRLDGQQPEPPGGNGGGDEVRKEKLRGGANVAASEKDPAECKETDDVGPWAGRLRPRKACEVHGARLNGGLGSRPG